MKTTTEQNVDDQATNTVIEAVGTDAKSSAGSHIEKVAGHTNYHGIDTTAVQPGADAAFEAKISIMNEALIDLGMNSFQWKLFLLTGLGWFVDNLWLQAITIVGPPVAREFQVQRIAFLTVAKYAGLVVGSSVWPMTADFIGRRLAFNITLLLSSVAALVGAGSPNFTALCTLSALIGLGCGGNQPVDSAIFLEFMPATHQNLLTIQSSFLALGYATAALVSWPLIVNFSCPSTTPKGECTYSDNMGWRYVYWTLGGLTLTMFLLRFSFHLYETPKYLLGRGNDSAAVRVVQKIAERDGKETWLTVAHFEDINSRLASQASGTASGGPSLLNNTSKSIIHRRLAKWAPTKIRRLFSTPRMALSTSLMILLWCSVGMAYPLYNSFIPIYFENKGVKYGSGSLNIVYRNYTIQAICGIPATFLGGYLVNLKGVGRKGTGTIASIGTGLFLFLFTRARNGAGILGFSCAISFCQYLVYALLYSYTPELFPTQIRGTGNGLVMLFNRLSGLMAPIIAAYVGVETSVPIWISAALMVTAGCVFLVLPYETRGRAAS